LDLFIRVSPKALGTSAKEVSRDLGLNKKARRGKEDDYTVSSALGDTEGINCQSKSHQISAARR